MGESPHPSRRHSTWFANYKFIPERGQVFILNSRLPNP